MSIYIKGVEMPAEGVFCIDIFPDGRVAGHYDCTIKRAKALPVPAHGRLIDADALEIDAQKRMLLCNKNNNQFQKPYEIMRAIALAPTIFPAEEVLT